MTYGIGIISKEGCGFIYGRPRNNNLLLINERVNMYDTGNGVHDQDLCVNVVIRVIQSFEEARNVLHVIVFVNNFGKIACGKNLTRTSWS